MAYLDEKPRSGLTRLVEDTWVEFEWAEVTDYGGRKPNTKHVRRPGYRWTLCGRLALKSWPSHERDSVSDIQCGLCKRYLLLKTL